MTDSTIGARKRRVSDIPLRADFVTEIQSEQRMRTVRQIVRDVQNTLKDYMISHPRETMMTHSITSHDPRYSAADLYALAPHIRTGLLDIEMTSAWLAVDVHYHHCWWGSPITLCRLPPRHTLLITISW
jgi:hypothetical protein